MRDVDDGDAVGGHGGEQLGMGAGSRRYGEEGDDRGAGSQETPGHRTVTPGRRYCPMATVTWLPACSRPPELRKSM